MVSISPFLWFDTQAEDALRYYVEIFPESSMGDVMRNEDGSALVAQCNIAGQDVIALNGGQHNKLTEAFSFMVHCDGQEEVDKYWSLLTDGGKEIMCGWLTDRFGLSWQIVPVQFNQLMSSGTDAQRGAVMGAMMKMVKFDVAGLQAAFDAAAESA